jgi:hypothetical protein
MPTALDDGQRSPRKLLAALVRKHVAAQLALWANSKGAPQSAFARS